VVAGLEVFGGVEFDGFDVVFVPVEAGVDDSVGEAGDPLVFVPVVEEES